MLIATFTSVSSKELGTNCWLAKRFIKGSRCPRVVQCKYPEKKGCKAVVAEIAHLREKRVRAEQRFHDRISKLIAEQTL